MKKVLLTALLLTSLATPVYADNQAIDPKPLPQASSATVKTIGNITFKFTSGNVGNVSVFQDDRYSDDVVIEQVLKSLWKQGGIKQVTHVNGKSIELTKWKNYGGNIPQTGTPGTGTIPPTGQPSTGGNATPNTQKPGTKPAPNTIPSKIRVVVDNEPVFFEDYGNVQPFIKDNRTLVPMRAVYEHFNVQATVQWDNEKRTVTATNREGKTIVFTIDKKEYQVIHPDGRVEKKINDVAPTIKNGRTMLPLRALGEAYGFVVVWFDPTKVVDMKSQGNYKAKLLPKATWEDQLKKQSTQQGVKAGETIVKPQ